MAAKKRRRNGSDRATAQCPLKIDGNMGMNSDDPMAAKTQRLNWKLKSVRHMAANDRHRNGSKKTRNVGSHGAMAAKKQRPNGSKRLP
jgi:hypothetical protein